MFKCLKWVSEKKTKQNKSKTLNVFPNFAILSKYSLLALRWRCPWTPFKDTHTNAYTPIKFFFSLKASGMFSEKKKCWRESLVEELRQRLWLEVNHIKTVLRVYECIFKDYSHTLVPPGFVSPAVMILSIALIWAIVVGLCCCLWLITGIRRR